jgi:hypothetical protein
MNPQASSNFPLIGPSELTGALPRKVHLTRNGVKSWMLTAGIVFFTLCICIYFSVNLFIEERQGEELKRDGRLVVGKVTKQWEEGRASSSFIRYTFNVNEIPYIGEAQIPNFSGITINEADQILIRFVPTDPNINHPDAWAWSVSMDTGGILLLALLILVCTVSIAVPYGGRVLATEGWPAQARVIACAPKNRGYWISYEFQTEDRTLMSGRKYRIDHYEVGASVWVLYLPQKPERNDLYPLSNYYAS